MVDFPQPEAPIRHTNSPGSIDEVDAVQRGDGRAAGPEGLADTAQLDDAHSPFTAVVASFARVPR